MTETAALFGAIVIDYNIVTTPQLHWFCGVVQIIFILMKKMMLLVKKKINLKKH
eukprot:UN05787